MIDIVFPKNNEEKFLEIASKLSYDKLCFVYEFKDKKDFKEIKAEFEKLKKKTKLKLALGLLCNKDIKTDADLIFVKSQEKLPKDFDIIIQSSNIVKWPHATYRQLKEKLVGIPFSEIINSTSKEAILSKLDKFIFLCRKYRITYALASYAREPYEMRSVHDLKSFFITLGMHPANVKSGFDAVEKLLAEKDIF